MAEYSESSGSNFRLGADRLNAEELIELNNEKRELLNEENEAYYSNLLIYIRLKSGISEQQTEELLMELLDHLLEAQEVGKSAEEVFGDDPKAYCDEMIGQLPKENPKKKYSFIGFLLARLVAMMAIGGGGAYAVADFFTDVSLTIHLGSAILSLVIQIALVIGAVAFLFFSLQQTTFFKRTKILDFVIFGIFGLMFLIGFYFIPNWIPSFGVSMEFPGLSILIFGILLLLITYIVNKRYRIV